MWKLETWKLQHTGDTKADTQREDGQEKAGILLHQKSEHLAHDDLDKGYLRSKSCPKFFILQTQLFLLAVARGLVKVSRRVLSLDDRL
jgi:hypothetical protein